MDLPGFAFAGNCVATADGGVVGISYLDHKITKLDADGTLLWSFVIDTSALQYLITVTETEDHGIVAVGSHDNWTASLVWKLDQNGNLLWQKRFNPQGQNLTVHWVCPAHGDGGFLIGGGECAMQYYVVRCDANGDILWQKQYFGLTTAPTGYIPTCVQAQGSGYLCTFNRLESGDLDWGIFKIDDTGNLVWAKALDEGVERDEVKGAVKTAAGGMAVLGTTTNYQAPNNENKMTLTVFGASGNILNYRVYDYTEQLQPRAITQTDDGGFVLTGSTFSLETMLVKTDGLGGIQWQKLDAGSASQEGYGLANAGNDMFFLSAMDFTHKTTLSKMSASTGQGICNESPLQLSPSTRTVNTIPLAGATTAGTASAVALTYPHHTDNTAASTICTFVATASPSIAQAMQCSPNPFLHRMRVDLGATLQTSGWLRLYDLQGRAVAELEVAAGNSAVEWAMHDLVPGAFFLRLEAEGLSKSLKVVHIGE